MTNGAFQTERTERQPIQNTERPKLADSGILWQALDNVLSNGAAVTLAQTAQGRTLSILILDGAERHKTWISNDAELQVAIAWLDEKYGGRTKGRKPTAR